MSKPSDNQMQDKLNRLARALDLPDNKWEERDKQWLYGAVETLEWVLGQRSVLKSPEAGVQ